MEQNKHTWTFFGEMFITSITSQSIQLVMSTFELNIENASVTAIFNILYTNSEYFINVTMGIVLEQSCRLWHLTVKNNSLGGTFFVSSQTNTEICLWSVPL